MKNVFLKRSRLVLLTAAAVMLTAAVPVTRYFVELKSVKISTYSVTAGGMTSAIATMSAIVQQPVQIVSFKSSNTAVAVPVGSSMPVMSGTATMPVRGVGAGCAEITASYGTKSSVGYLVVHPATATSSFGFSVPDKPLYFAGNAAYEGVLTRSLTLSTPTRSGSPATLPSWTVTSSNPSVITVPATVPQAGPTTKFLMKPMRDGCAQITAQLGDQSITRTVFAVYIGG